MRSVDEVLQSRGGRAFYLEDLADKYIAFGMMLMALKGKMVDWEEVEKKQTVSPPRALEIAFVANESVNAFATVCTGSDGQEVGLIGVHAGTVFELRALIDALVVKPGVLEDLKAVGDEIASDAASQEEAAARSRVTGAAALLMLAFEFVIHHELRHLLNGHCDLVRKTAQLEAISEDESFASKVDMSRYALEFDADSLAVNDLCFSVLGRVSWAASTKLAPGLKNLYKTPETAAYHLGFAIALFVCLTPGSLESPLGGPAHPALHVRFSWMLGTVGTLEVKEKVPVGFGDRFMEGAIDALAAVAAHRGDPPPKDFLLTGFDHGQGGLLTEIRAAWARVRVDLEPLARHSHLAPADPNA